MIFEYVIVCEMENLTNARLCGLSPLNFSNYTVDISLKLHFVVFLSRECHSEVRSVILVSARSLEAAEHLHANFEVDQIQHIRTQLD